ncbi:MAG: LytTR family DNA-binding domain-containing protein, partial [Gemmobacter sp.]
VVLGLSGPFGTWDALAPLPRLAYWTAVTFGTYGLGAALTLGVVAPLDRDGAHPVWQVARGGAIVGAGVAVLLVALGLVAFGWRGPSALLPGTSVLGAFVVAWVILGLRALWLRESPAPAGPPAILRRLPIERRGTLLALSVQDHYVEVVTARGRGLVLMRLRDAIDETAGVEGVQVHRSHWVALSAVRSARRQGDGAALTLVDGTVVPVSRARMAAVRAAGLLV